MADLDVIVIGAGPAGSCTAYRLARAGARVALLDRARFPRDKPCGGGITLRGLQHLPIDVTPVVEDRIVTAELAFAGGGTVIRDTDSPVVYMTQRRRLDAHLAQAAAAAGADFRDGVRVRGIDLDGSGGTVRTDSGSLSATVIVGADGCNGVSAKALGLGGPVTYGVAYEGNVGWDLLDHDHWRGRLLLEFGTVPGGYAWIFPKGDHANIGVGGWPSEGPQLRTHLAGFSARSGIPAAAVAHARGYRLPLRHPAAPVAHARALVIGDAAGLVDPLSGDGMYEAFLSSRLAAACVGDLLEGTRPDLTHFTALMNGALSSHRAVSWAGKLLFDQFPRAAERLARSRTLWPHVVRRIRGERVHTIRPRPQARAEMIARALYRPHRGDRRNGGDQDETALPPS